MFVVIEHDIHDPAKFQQNAQRVFPLPAELRVHQFLPAKDLSRATCLYEAPSLDQVRAHLDTAIGDAGTQYYFPVAEDKAIGLPPQEPV